MLRDAVEPDLDQCLALVAGRFLYDAKSLDSLRRMWSAIITSKCGSISVAVDDTANSQVLAFNAVVFAPDTSVESYHRGMCPSVGYTMLQAWSAGESAFLTREEIANANAGAGLNRVVCHLGCMDLGSDAVNEDFQYGTDYLSLNLLRGWNLRTFTLEIFTRYPESEQAIGEANGFKVVRYTPDQLLAAGIQGDDEPLLWISTRKDTAGLAAGTVQGAIFRTYTPPRFRFTSLEQELLQHACDGHTDQSLSKLLNISLTATKKLFRTIYEKVEESLVRPDLLPVREPLSDGTRGHEMRRHLLIYLRDHPEELRPYLVEPRRRVP